MKRPFTAALSVDRCSYTITLRDGSAAQCMRKKTKGDLCTQHSRIVNGWSCEYCGGNDETPPGHCMDCERPKRTTP